MSMDKTIANLSLIKNKTSDFKLELGRVKDEFTNAILSLVNIHLEEAQKSNDKFSINLFSDIDKSIKYFTKTDDFSLAIEKINQLLKTFELDIGLQIIPSTDININNVLNIFITEYGLTKFYRATKDQVLLDFDNLYNSPEAKAVLETPAVNPPAVQPTVRTPPISSRQISIFQEEPEGEEEEEEELEGEEEEGVAAAPGSESRLTAKEREELEAQLNIEDIPSSENLSSSDVRYSGVYYIRSFLLKIITKDKREFKLKYFAPITPEGKWLCTKNGKTIFTKTEIRAENRAQTYATQALDKKPEGFLEWVSSGGQAKNIFYTSLPEIGKGKSADKDEESATKASMSEAIIAYNLNYSSHFFTREEVSLSRNFNLAEEKLKKELKTDLNLFSVLSSIYPDFSSLQNQDMILYIDETSLPHKLIIDKNLSTQFNNFVFQKISDLNRLLDDAYKSAARNMNVSIAETARYEISKKIDDLLSACKIRDRIIYNKFLSLKSDTANRSISTFDYESINRLNIEEILVSNSLKSQSTKLGIALFNFTQMLCFASSAYINSFAAKMVKGNAAGDAQNIFLNEDLISKAFNEFSRTIGNQISSKISIFFNPHSIDSSTNLYCRYISSSINTGFIYKSAYNYAVKPVRLGWNYISCPTCKKDIYYSKYTEIPSGTKSDLVPLLTSKTSLSEAQIKAYIDPLELSDYEEERYSFFRPNGQIITTQELRAASSQTGKSWDDILKMISSNNQTDHNTGVKEREALLKSLGAKIIKRKGGRGASAVFSYKTKCPFSGLSLPQSMQTTLSAMNNQDKSFTIKDFSCGLSLNVDDLVSADRAIEPYELHSSTFDPAVDPELKLNEAINSSISKGLLKEEDRERFIQELNKRRAGGWKFSNVMFKCPCKPSLDSKLASDIKNIRKNNYIASPISGFFTNEYFQKGIIHPPSTENGDLHSLEDYTSSYVICGNTTSISSFCRDTSDPNSLYGILKTKIKESLVDSNKESAAYVSNIIDTLLQLGVDFNDILPFIDRIYAEEIGKTISSSHRNKINSIIKNAIETDMDRSSHDKEMGLSRAQILGDLKLVCSEGHRFKIIDSIKFGQTHIGYSIPKSGPYLKGLGGSSLRYIMQSSGIKNLMDTLATEIPKSGFGQKILVRVDKNELLPNMKNFNEWDGFWDSEKGLSEFYYMDASGNYYVFGSGKRSVIWGNAEKAESAAPFVQKDRRTQLLVRTASLEVSDGPTDEDESGSGPTLTDKMQADEYASTINDLQKDTTAHERARLDIYYSPIAVILQTVLKSVKDFCDRATSLNISAPLYGRPVSLKNEDKIIPLVKEIIGKVYLRQAEEFGDLDSARESLNDVIEDGFNYFNKNYLENLKVQDIRFLSMIEPSVSSIEPYSIARSILLAITTAVEIHQGEEGFRYDKPYSLEDLSSRIHDPELKIHIQNELFSPDLFKKVEEISEIIKSNAIEGPKETAKTEKVFKDLIKGESRLAVANLQGSEYIGRVMMMSSAIFLSESLSALYRKYLTETSSKYIGVDIGIDLSSPDKIIKIVPSAEVGSVFAITDDQISSIPTTFPVNQFLDQFLEDFTKENLDEEDVSIYQNIDNYKDYFIDDIERMKRRINKLRAENKNPTLIRRETEAIEERVEQRQAFEKWANGFINDYVDHLSEFLEAIKSEMLKIQIACTNYKYTEKAVELIRESILKKIELDKTATPSARQVTSAIVNRCITNSPITTISLSAGEKYHSYYAGSESGSIPKGGPFRLLPLFNAEVVEGPNIPSNGAPVFLLSGQNNGMNNLGIKNFTTDANKHVILYKDIQGNFITPYGVELGIADVVLSGWKIGLIDSSKVSVNFKKEISLFYHPYTLAVLNDGSRVKPSFDEKIAGFVNSHTGYNSIGGFHFGPQATRSGVLTLYPTPYAHGDSGNNGGTHVGLLIPIEYGRTQEKLQQSYTKLAPFFDAKIPIELPTDSPGNVIRINISDFLVRDPPDKAEQILSDISKRYVEYKEEEKRIQSIEEKKKQRERCKKDIAEMFDRYRHLPYKVTNAPSSSAVKYTGSLGEEGATVSSAVSAYIPMADFVTCNKILSYEEFSPEFGGHNFWAEGDTSSIPAVKGAIEQMIINSNNLDELAVIMNSQLNDNEVKITAKDLLDPHNGVFNKIYQKVKKDEMSRGGSSDESVILKKTVDLIRTITAYNVGSDYIPLSSADKDVAERLGYQYRSDTFWSSMPQEVRYKYLNDPSKKFKKWIASIGKSYLIRSGSSPENGEPGARLKVMSEIFPYNDEDGTGRVLDLQQIQDPNSSRIISQDDFNYSSFLYGKRHTVDRTYFTGGTITEGEKFLEEVKKLESKKETPTMVISAVKYASGISDFFVSNIITGLRERIRIEKERGDIQRDIESVRPISKKASAESKQFLKVRVAPMEAVDNIRMAGMISLLSMFTK